ncbi:MAG: thiol reductant ABC exporter subunit CydC [Actinobacteria bacterium]|nr:thiol reductant ABC exporter subunit CydC [Actinomycetota bacterium]
MSYRLSSELSNESVPDHGRILVGTARPESRRVLLAVLVGSVGQLSALGLMATSAWLITKSSLRPPVLALSVAIGAVQFFALARGAGRYGERLAGHDVALRILARLRVWVFRRLEHLVPGGLTGVGSGDILARLVSDVDATQDLVVRNVIPLAVGGITMIGAVLFTMLVLPPAGVVLAGGLFLAGVVIPATARVVGRSFSRSLSANRGRLANQLVEAIEGVADLISFGAVVKVLARLERAEQAISRIVRNSAVVSGVANGLGATVTGMTTIAVVAVGAVAVGDHRLSGVAVATLGFVSLAAFEAIAVLPESFARIDQALGALKRVEGLAQMRPPVVDPLHPDRLMPGPAVLALHRATVSYRSAVSPAIEGVDLELAPGKRVALVGPSGAGKTTITLVLLRFIELDAGSITLDDVDCRRIAADEVRSKVAWAPQEPHVFATTVAANLRLARPDASDADLVRILSSLGLSRWLAALPRGLDTMLGQNGATISGGERKRLGLARALLAERPIVVLDEPTAHLDDVTECQVRQAVLGATTGQSLLWVTHRLVGLEDFDEVVLLDRGRVIERGSFTSLLSRDGAFAKLLAASLPNGHLDGRGH